VNNREKLAVLTTLEKLVKEEKAAVRAECDAEIAELCEAYGTEKIGLTLNGAKVGDFLIAFNPEGFTVVDREAFEEFALDYGLASVKRSIRPTMMHAAIKVLEGAMDAESVRDYVVEEVVVVGDWEEHLAYVGGRVLFADSGLEVPGVVFRPRSMNGTKVRGCKPQDVVPILQSLPGGINPLLLGGGE
jgi:hypothetical protein